MRETRTEKASEDMMPEFWIFPIALVLQVLLFAGLWKLAKRAEVPMTDEEQATVGAIIDWGRERRERAAG